MFDIVLTITTLLATSALFLFLYRRKTPSLDEVFFTWLFSSWYDLFIDRLAVQFKWYSYISPSLTKTGTFILADIVFFPLAGQIYLMLLRKSLLINLFITTVMAGVMTLNEAVVIRYSQIVEYKAGNYVWIFLSYFGSFIVWAMFAFYYRKWRKEQFKKT